MTSPPMPTGYPGPGEPSRTRSGLAALVILAGAFWVVLAGRRSLSFDLDRHLVPKELALHVTALLCLFLLIPTWKRLRLSMVDLLLVLAAFWALASSVLATNHWIAARSLGVSISALFLYAAARYVATSRWKPLVLAGIALAGVSGAAIGLAQAYGLDLDILATTRLPGGTFGNRNFMAHLVTIGLPILLVSSLGSPNRGTKVLARVGIAISIAAIVLTRSRAAWLGVVSVMGITVTAALVVASWRRTLSRKASLSTAGAVLLGIGAAVFLPNRLAWNSESPYRDSLAGLVDSQSGSGRGRVIQYRNSLELVREAPVFGQGPGNWFVHYPRVTTPGDPSFAGWDTIPTNPWPSSDWIAFVTEVGIPGALLLLLAGLAMIVTALRRLGPREEAVTLPWLDGQNPALSGGGSRPGESIILIATLSAAAVTGAFDVVLHLAAPTLFVSTIAGLLVPASGVAVDREMAKPARRVLVGGSLVVLVVLVSMSLGQDRTIRITRTDRSVAMIRSALRFDPTNVRLHLRLARSGPCTARLRHARIARSLLPYHKAPREALLACGQSS